MEHQQRHETHKHRTASCTSTPSSASRTPWSPIYALETSHVLQHGHAVSPSPRKRQQTAAHPTSLLVHFLLWCPNKCTSSTHVRRTNACLLLESFIPCPFTCLLQQNILSPVSASAKCSFTILSEPFTLLNTLTKHSFTCLPQQITFHRTLKFPLHRLASNSERSICLCLCFPSAEI